MQISTHRLRLLPALALLLAAVLPAQPSFAGHGTVVHRAPAPPTAQALAAQAEEVRATEAAFARTMAARDFAAFSAFIAPDAVFVDEPTLRGAEAVRAGWKPLFEGPKAAFSWEPGTVEVLGSGGLAMSYGPVFNAKGERISTFYSVWRRGPDGHWRIIFDHGCESCRCAGPGSPAASSLVVPAALPPMPDELRARR
jgi:ketosteroid isomerase-like protein